MKALSLWQPWASLIAIGAKQYETRSWSTTYRGPLVIHAAKRDTEAKVIADAIYRWRYNTHAYNSFVRRCVMALYEDADKPIGAFIPKLPLGAALCIADLVGVYHTETVRDKLSETERAFGDYSNDRFAWQLDNIRPFNDPIPMRGAQGLFECHLPTYEETQP